MNPYYGMNPLLLLQTLDSVLSLCGLTNSETETLSLTIKKVKTISKNTIDTESSTPRPSSPTLKAASFSSIVNVCLIPKRTEFQAAKVNPEDAYWTGDPDASLTDEMFWNVAKLKGAERRKISDLLDLEPSLTWDEAKEKVYELEAALEEQKELKAIQPSQRENL